MQLEHAWQAIGAGAALAMDAVAVAVAATLRTPHRVRLAITLALVFGAFQAGMAWLGGALGVVAAAWVASVDHWIAFVLLGGIGVKMIVDGLRGGGDAAPPPAMGALRLLTLGVATSVDALVVGIGMALDGSPIVAGGAIIGLVTAALVALGATLSRLVPARAPEIVGGALLIAIGTRILVQHLRGG